MDPDLNIPSGRFLSNQTKSDQSHYMPLSSMPIISQQRQEREKFTRAIITATGNF